MDVALMQSFVSLGFGHITAPGALDHILFLLVLAAIYRWAEWRQALVVITAFTVGHSVTLVLAVLKPEWLPSPRVVEFLIPLTIVATGIENIIARGLGDRRVHMGRRAMFAGGFGLIHGAGFAGYLSELMPGAMGMPLLGFNIGIEIGQVVVLTVSFAGLGLTDRVLRGFLVDRAAFTLRMALVSLSVAVAAGVWAVERAPW